MPTIRDPTDCVGQAAPATYPINAPESHLEGERSWVCDSHRFDRILGGSKRSAPARFRDSDRPHLGNTERESPDLTPVADLTRWFRLESPPRVFGDVARRRPLRLVSQSRVLVGISGPTAHARIQINTGQLAGSEIHIAMTDSRLDAQLLTRNEASRQTLMAAMDAVRENLRTRALLVETTGARHPSDGQRRDPALERQDSPRGRRNGTVCK